MRAYYNENNPKAAAWLRELIKEGLIADGDVDERSIEDVIPKELEGYRQCHFFAGIGGGSLTPLAHGIPEKVGRLCGYGNAIVIPQAKEFIESYILAIEAME